jgi:hypothetical protein
MTMADLDAELIAALKLAKSKEMFFAFIPKGPEGTLIISKKKIPPKQIADTKRETGGGKPVIGKCFGPIGNMVFKVAKQPSPTLAAAIKKVAKNDAGLTVIADVQVSSDVEDEDMEDTGAPASAATAPAAPAPAAPAVALNLGPWQTARQDAIKDLKALATKVAATKHPDAAGVLMEINSIIAKLPPNPAPQEIDKLATLIHDDDAIAAAEEAPSHFHVLKIRQPLLNALQAMKR